MRGTTARQKPAPDGDRRPKPPRWHRRKQSRPAEILAAARKLFAERGYAATRLEDVARHAGVTKGTMYLYFESKEALFMAMVRDAILPSLERRERLLDEFQGSSRELLRLLLSEWWEALVESDVSGLPKLMIAEAGNFPELASFYHTEVVQRGRRLMARALQRGIQSGEFRQLDIEYALRGIQAPVLLASVWKHSMLRCEPAPLDFHRYMDVVIDMLLYGVLRKDAAAGAAPERPSAPPGEVP